MENIFEIRAEIAQDEAAIALAEAYEYYLNML